MAAPPQESRWSAAPQRRRSHRETPDRAAGRSRLCLSRRPHAAGGELHGADDLDVAGAPAEVALESGADLRLGGLGRRLEETRGGHDHPRRAETALGAAL